MINLWFNQVSALAFIPHGHCYLWNPSLVGLHLVSDTLIALAYYSIPAMLVYFIGHKRDILYSQILWLFSIFIAACGTSHLMEVWTLWHPTYWISGAMKAVTAIVSFLTAIQLIPIIPHALALKSPAELEVINRELAQEIVRRQQAEQTLRESQANLQAILDYSPNYIYLKDCQGQYFFIGRFLADLVGTSQEQIVGKTDYDLFSSEIADGFQESDRQVLTTGKALELENQIPLSDGIHTYITVKFPVYDAAGTLYGVGGISTDITDRKLAEEALRQSERRYLAILEDQTELITRYLPDGTLTFVNEAYCRFFGVNREEIVGHHYAPVVFEEDRDRVAELIATISSENPVVVIENRVIVGGEVRWTQWVNRAIFDDKGRLVKLQSVGRDISDRKQIEQALFESEKRLQLALEGSGDGLWDWNIATGEVYYSPRYFEMLGYEADELPQQLSTWEYLVHPEDIVWVKEILDAHFKDGSVPYAFDYRLRTKSGEWKWVADYGKVVVRDENGKPLRMTGTHRDASDRKQAEEALRHSQHFLQKIADALPQILYLFDLKQGTSTYLNQQSITVLGYSPEEICNDRGEWLIEHFHPDDRYLCCDLQSRFTNLSDKDILSTEYQFLHKNGEWRWLCTREVVFARDAGGIPTQILGAVEDISDRKKAELELKQAKEAAEVANRAKSAFLANMSHELRTPLNAILGFAQLMSKSPALTPEYQRNIAIIHRSGEHLLSLINDVLDMAKIEAGRTTLKETNFDLYRLLDDLKEMFELRADNKNLQLSVDCVFDVPQWVRTDELKLRQVLINLLSNAIKFTSTGSVTLRVEIGKEASGIAHGEKESPLALCPSPLFFEISDTGCGIAPEEIDSIFEAFVQTTAGQRSHEGTGLGLAISRKFVELMGGKIAVSSEVGKGSTFLFDIQISPVEAIDITTKQTTRRVIALEPNQPRYRILVADDRWDNRLLVAKLLSPLGFEIKEARNGVAAVEIWDAWEPHLIFMDLRMPVVDGCEATKQIKATPRGQATAIVALTASSFEEDVATAARAGCDDFIRKPFQEAEIFEIIHKHTGVRYVCAEPASAPATQIDALALTPEALRAFSDDWVASLHQATIQGDIELIRSLIGEIREQNYSLASALASLANNFLFDKLLSLTERKENL